MLNLPNIPIQDVIEARNEILALMSRLAQRSLFGMVTVNIAGYPDGFLVRTGMRKEPLARLFATSVTLALFNRLTGAALWVSR